MKGATVPDWFPTALTVAGSVIVAVLGTLGVLATIRASSRAQKKTDDTANRQVDVDEWQAILAELRTDRAEDRKQIDRLSERVDALEKSLREKDNMFRALMAYTRTLLRWIHETIPAEEAPLPPTQFVDDLIYTTGR